MRDSGNTPNSHNWSVGDRIFHPSLGEGWVTKIFKSQHKSVLVVRFPGQGLKLLDSTIAPITKLGRSSKEEFVAFLECREAELELLEKASAQAKRWRKYLPADPSEVWATRWIANPAAYLFPAERREEWLGDLYEINREMRQKRYPGWAINLINIGCTLILILSAINIKISDLFSFGMRKIE